jgi:hypothetical protein
MRFEEQNLSTGDLVLEADSNESYVVQDFGVDGGGEDDIVTVSIGEETMFAFPVEDGEDTLFREDSLQEYGYSLYGLMRNAGIPAPMLQVPEGDDLTVTTDGSSGNVTVKYREGAASLASPAQPGGPETKDRVYPVSGEGTATGVSDSTQVTINVDTSRQPAALDDFPFGTDCPNNREFDLLALSLVLDGDVTSGTIDSFRLTTEEQRFLAQDAEFVDADNAQYPGEDPDDGPLLFPLGMGGPQTYAPGDELDLEVQATNTSGGSGDLNVKATFIFDRRGL